jgi:zinc protease
VFPELGVSWEAFTLSNGLRVLFVPKPGAPIFHMQTWFRVGAKTEKLDPALRRTGLAHLFEHMMFRGTAAYPDGRFDETMTQAGAQGENATTWLDRTNYFQSLPSDRLALALELESDRMTHLAVSPELLETEKGAVLGELRMGQDDPFTVGLERLYREAFASHPYGNSTIGTEAEIKSFTAPEAMAFYRRYYSPGNAFLIFVGELDSQVLRAQVERYYGGIPAQQVPRVHAPAEPAPLAERRVRDQHPQLQQPLLLIGYRVPGAFDEIQPTLAVLRALLAEGQGSWLQREWVDTGLAVDAHGTLDEFADPGLLMFVTELLPGKGPKASALALEEAACAALDSFATRFAALGPRVQLAEVERARGQVLLSLHRACEDPEGLGHFVGESLAIQDGDWDPGLPFRRVERVRAVTAADVLVAARRYLVPAARTRVLLERSP